MTPALHDMPVHDVWYDDATGHWLLEDQDGAVAECLTTADAERLVDRQFPGSAVRFLRGAPPARTERPA